jgi:hypothetical protein
VTAKRRLLNTANRVLRPAGVRLERLPVDGRADGFDAAERSRRAAQHGSERLITARHNDQSLDDVRRLNAKYAASVLGEIDTWELLMMLGACVDPTDSALGAVSQLAHVLQTLEMMIADGVTDEDLLLVALVHDIGKVLLLTDEDPANVVCMNRFISGEPGAGLEQGTTQWNHDEFGYSRLVDVLPRELALLVRYHSVMPHDLEPYLAPSDRAFAERYHRPFFRYDQESKSAVRRPSVCLEDFRSLVGRRLPSRLEI